ncbi:ATP-dependent Clp protease adaptor ClpS [candidate division KSB1 bacterium]|nr:ATP-dependent Clp protease adaptor ClpS [candidate division KSB1 bacterium]
MPEVAVPVKKRRSHVQQRPREITIPRYHVVLLDDDDHTYDYVIEMLMKLFGHSRERAFLMACEVDGAGRVIVDTTTKERAELKRDQIHAYGSDWRIPRCKGAMSAIVEPAPGNCNEGW